MQFRDLRSATTVGAAAVLVALAVGCGGPTSAQSGDGRVFSERRSPATTVARPAVARTTSTTTTIPPVLATTAPGPPAIGVADGHGWGPTGLFGPVPAPDSCRSSADATGVVFPDPRCTPGMVDGAVSQATLSTTICRPGGYTSSVRPPESMTNAAKAVSMRSYSIGGPASAFEYDHFVPLALGGASDVRNLWPEPDDPAMTGFDRNAKDVVEVALWRAVCAGRTTLEEARAAIVANWSTARQRLGV